MNVTTKLRSAFSLLEVSIILTGISVLITSSVAIKNRSLDSDKYLETKQKINAIEVAVAAYFVKNGYFPCPADPTINIKDRSVGVSEVTSGSNETCDTAILSSDGDFYAGSVPTQELGLSYNYILDGWGNKLTFITPAGTEFDDYIDVPTSIADTPTDYANLILWADSSDESTITQDSSGYISVISDKSGSGYDLRQDSLGFSPQFIRDGDLPAISFDGTDDYFYIDNNYYGGAVLEGVTVFVVFKSSSSQYQMLVTYDRNEYWRLALKDNYGTNNIGFDTTALDYLASADTHNSTTSIDYADGVIHVMSAKYNKNVTYQKKIHIDGERVVSEAAHVSPVANLGSGTTRYGFVGVGSEATTVDGTKSPEYYLYGNLYELLIYDDALSSDDSKTIRSYLTAKWQNGDAAYQDAGPFLQVNDINDSLVEDQAVFALISYGPTGNGAYSKGGVVDDNSSTSYNVLANGFDSQAIVTDYIVSGSELVERDGWRDGFSQVVRYYTVSDIQNLTE